MDHDGGEEPGLPTWQRPPVTASEVLRLARGEAVPGVNHHDLQVQRVQECRVSPIGHEAVASALKQGYLFVNVRIYESEDAANLTALWATWCAAAGHPEIVMRTSAGTDAVTVRCDLGPTERSWGFDVFGSMARLMVGLSAVDRADWLFTPEVIQLEELEMEEAITVARGLVDIATAGRFRPQDVPTPPDQPISGTPFPQHTRIERTDET
jgi:hypothetical protein